MNKLNWSHIAIGAGTTLLVGIIVYLVLNIFSLHRDIEEAKEKARLWSDSLKVVSTELGNVYEKHAIETAFQAGVIAQLNHNLQIALSISSEAPVIVNEKEDFLFTLFQPTFEDEGLRINIQDSVWFKKHIVGIWTAEQRLHLTGELFLEQTVGRDSTGNFFGRVETKSKAMRVTSLATYVDDRYKPKTSFKVSSQKHLLGIAVDADLRSFAAGVAFNIGNYQFSAKYILLSQDMSKEFSWQERLRLGGVYYIW